MGARARARGVRACRSSRAQQALVRRRRVGWDKARRRAVGAVSGSSRRHRGAGGARRRGPEEVACEAHAHRRAGDGTRRGERQRSSVLGAGGGAEASEGEREGAWVAEHPRGRRPGHGAGTRERHTQRRGGARERGWRSGLSWPGEEEAGEGAAGPRQGKGKARGGRPAGLLGREREGPRGRRRGWAGSADGPSGPGGEWAWPKKEQIGRAHV